MQKHIYFSPHQKRNILGWFPPFLHIKTKIQNSWLKCLHSATLNGSILILEWKRITSFQGKKKKKKKRKKEGKRKRKERNKRRGTKHSSFCKYQNYPAITSR